MVNEEEQVVETIGAEQEIIEFEPLGDNELIEEESLTDEQAERLLMELETGEREFSVNDRRMKVVTPSAGDILKADREYARAFNEALDIGLPLQEQLEEKLIAKGFIESDDEFDKTNQKFREEIARLEIKLEQSTKAKNDKTSKKVATDLVKIRNSLLSGIIRRNTLLNSSVEAKAEEARSAYLTSRCVLDIETNEPVWESFDAYLSETDQLLMSRVSYEFASFSSGVSTNFMAEFPEVKYLEGR